MLLLAGLAPAQAPEPGGDREAAKERFVRGRELFKQQLWGAALAELLEARRLYADAWAPTSYAAACLSRLGRFDESLDLYAILLRDFGEKLTPAARDSALQEVENARRMVGTLEIEGSEPGATLMVDSQVRGHYPLLAPLRVPGGSHIVRAFKEGYEPIEKRVEVAGGTTVRVQAKLQKLLQTGTLQVREALGRELDVLVDGFPAGKTPLDLPLSPGKHTVLLRGDGDLGSAPATVQIRADEPSPLRIEAELLSASLRVVPVPFDALVSIDSVLVGRGAWEGRARAGGHKIEVAAEGFLAETRKVELARGKRAVIEVELPRDPKSPFWREPPPPPHFLIELSSGVLLSPAIGGEVSSTCTGACQMSPAVGTFATLRGGYELGSGLSFGVAAGYATARQSIRQRRTELQVVGLPSPVDLGSVRDTIAIRGLFAGAWAGFSFAPLSPRFPVHLRLSGGALWGEVSDARLGVFEAQLAGGSYPIGTAVERRSATFVFVTPEVRMGLKLRPRVELYAGLEVPIWLGLPSPRWSEAHPIRAGVDGYGWFRNESFIGSLVLGFVPGVGVKLDL